MEKRSSTTSEQTKASSSLTGLDFDPTTGQALKPVTPEVVRELDRLREGPLAEVDPATVAWFNPYTDRDRSFGITAIQMDTWSFITGRELIHTHRRSTIRSYQRTLPDSRSGSSEGGKFDVRLASFRAALIAESGRGTAGLLTLGDDEAADDLARHLQGFNGNALRVDSLRKQGFGSAMYDGDATLLTRQWQLHS